MNVTDVIPSRLAPVIEDLRRRETQLLEEYATVHELLTALQRCDQAPVSQLPALSSQPAPVEAAPPPDGACANPACGAPFHRRSGAQKYCPRCRALFDRQRDARPTPTRARYVAAAEPVPTLFAEERPLPAPTVLVDDGEELETVWNGSIGRRPEGGLSSGYLGSSLRREGYRVLA